MSVRSGTRRILRHLMLAALVILGTGTLFAVTPHGTTAKKLSLATGFVGLALLGVTLMLGPLRERRGDANPVSTNLRRDFGIWAALVGTAHTVVGLRVHMKGDIVQYFVPASGLGVRMPKSVVAFLTANYTGLAATILLLVLLAISNDISLRKLGVTRWKRIQQLNYWLFALVIAHGVLYLLVDKSGWQIVVPFVAICVAVTAIQLAGRRARLAGGSGSPGMSRRPGSPGTRQTPFDPL